MATDPRSLKRPLQAMPDFVRQALLDRQLMSLYEARPAYQRNDYLGWINRAKQESTKHRRLQQMLDELAGGRSYMNMPWHGARRDA